MKAANDVAPTTVRTIFISCINKSDPINTHRTTTRTLALISLILNSWYLIMVYTKNPRKIGIPTRPNSPRVQLSVKLPMRLPQAKATRNSTDPNVSSRISPFLSFCFLYWLIPYTIIQAVNINSIA